MAVHPTQQRVAVGMRAVRRVTVFDLETLQPLIHCANPHANRGTGLGLLGVPSAHRLTPRGLAFSPDGARLYSASGSQPHQPGELIVWNPESGEPLFDPRPHPGGRACFSLGLSPDGSRAVTFDRDTETIDVWTVDVSHR
jgi:WD40 repeat protein